MPLIVGNAHGMGILLQGAGLFHAVGSFHLIHKEFVVKSLFLPFIFVVCKSRPCSLAL